MRRYTLFCRRRTNYEGLCDLGGGGYFYKKKMVAEDRNYEGLCGLQQLELGKQSLCYIIFLVAGYTKYEVVVVFSNMGLGTNLCIT